MANPTNFPEANALLERGQNPEEVSSLPIHCSPNTMLGSPECISCWELTPEELAEVQRTGRVWLRVAGVTHVPVCIQGLSPFSV